MKKLLKALGYITVLIIAVLTVSFVISSGIMMVYGTIINRSAVEQLHTVTHLIVFIAITISFLAFIVFYINDEIKILEQKHKRLMYENTIKLNQLKKDNPDNKPFITDEMVVVMGKK